MLELRASRTCYPEAVVGVNVALACVDGVIAVLAFYQLMRIHSRNLQLGWTRQKVFHLMIGSSNLGYTFYFVLTPIAACKDWICWSCSCGFIFMAFPQILLIAAFLLLLSFWVDLCHQSNDDDEDERCSSTEALLEKMDQTDSNSISSRRCFASWSVHVGSRQKIVILITVVIFAIMVAAAVLMWIGMGGNPVNSKVIAQAYVDLISAVVLLLGGALACYGLVLFLKMRRVRSEQASSEMRKVAGLAVVSVISFTSSSSAAIVTNIPLLHYWDEQQIDGVYTSLLLVLYYFIGSSVPSAFVLFMMRELPPPPLINKPEESTTIAFITDGSVSGHQQGWTTSTAMHNQVSRASPI